MADIDVPNVDGVPPLASYSPNNIVLLFADLLAALAGFPLPQWGIYLDGVAVLSYDNQLSFSYRQDWRISTYPVEQGSFQSYDKVQLPAEVRCRFSAGGSITNRQEMLASVDAVMSDTNTYDVVTPEAVYLRYNFMHRDYDKAAETAGMVAIDIVLQEIIETATSQYQNVQNAPNAGQQGLGQVQTGSFNSSLIGVVG